MSDYVAPHVEYLESVLGDPEASPSRQELTREMLMFGARRRDMASAVAIHAARTTSWRR